MTLLKTAKEEVLCRYGMQFVTNGTLLELVLVIMGLNNQSPIDTQYNITCIREITSLVTFNLHC